MVQNAARLFCVAGCICFRPSHHGAKHDGFSTEAFVSGFASIRKFLRNNGILTKE
jgi:hypothetical protein